MSGLAIIVTVALFVIQLLQALYTRLVQLSIDNAVKKAEAKGDAALAAHKLHVAENYSLKSELREVAEKFERVAERIFERIDDIANRLPPRS